MAKKKNNEPTVKELIELAKDLNNLMDLEPALPTAQKTTKDKLINEIKKVTKMLEPGDKLTKESITTLKVLGFEMPKPPESKPSESKPPKEKKAKSVKEKSRYGHKLGSQSAALDELFFKGTTIEKAAEKLGVKEGRVKGHLQHLKKDKGLEVKENKGVFKVAS